MKKALVLLAVLALAGCASPPASPPVGSTDADFLDMVRESVTTGTDESLVAAGRGVCADVARGASGPAMTAHVGDLGFTEDQAYFILLAAGLVFCPAEGTTESPRSLS